MSERNKKLIITGIVIILLGVIGFSGYKIASTLYSDNKEKQEAKSRVEEFKDYLTREDWDQIIEKEDYDPFEKITGTTVGVIFTDKLEYKQSTMVYEDMNDVDAVERSLNNHVVTYSNYGGIGLEGSNTVMSAHSALYHSGCGHCYFDQLERYEKDDTIEILWNNKKVYKYKVFMKEINQDPYAEWYYSQPEDNSQIITLITCSNGNPNVRTVVRAKLFEVRDWIN